MPKAIKLLLLLTATVLHATAQTLPYKAQLGHTLSNQQHVSNPGVVDTQGTFMPTSDFTVDLGVLMRSGTLQMTAANNAGCGFIANLTPNLFRFVDLNTEEEMASYPIAGTEKPQTYRIALKESRLHVYADTTLLGTHAALFFPILPDAGFYGEEDNATSHTGIYDERNLIRNPGFETEGVVVKSDARDYRYWPAEWEIAHANATSEQTRGVLSVTGDDGYPYGMPMNYE